MTTTIEAVYENGVLRPLSPLCLSEGQHIQVLVAQEEPAQAACSASILAEIAAMPLEGSCDPLASQDHDRILYRTPNPS